MIHQVPKDKQRQREESARAVEAFLRAGGHITQYDYAVSSSELKNGENQCGVCGQVKPAQAFARLAHFGNSKCIACVSKFNELKSVT